MKIKSLIPFVLLLIISMVSFTGCQKGDLIDNPNVAGANSIVPLSLVVNHLTSNLIKSEEQPFAYSAAEGQYVLSNYSYYRGINAYTFGNTIDSYDILKYALVLQNQSVKQLGNQTNKYYALAQFFKAYAGIWLAQRVGDIPFSAAGNSSNLTPVYDSQHAVYTNALTLLDNANSLLAALPGSGTILDSGDIFGFTILQWQKLINTYRLRVLISLSKRAGDTPDLNVVQSFNTIFTNPSKYPIMTSNSDNMVYVWNTVNHFPLGLSNYNKNANIGEVYLTATTSNLDPRTFAVATPAPAQIKAGKLVSDFTAYVGSNSNLTLSTLFTNSAPDDKTGLGIYSYANYTRYVSANFGTQEPFVFIGYPELCFNIAEAINRGWITGTTSTWYTNGINASLALYGITEGKTLTVGDVNGATLGTVTVNVAQFLAKVAYAGDNATGLNQILTQKYVTLFNNSGWEGFYNYRRTGVPAFDQGGSGIGTPNNLIPRRWQYPSTEGAYNTTNYNAAIASQGFGSDDPTKDTWLTK
jgi:hypothetical protein